ncbi:uncharacterized protein [Palaemon carinicauda]|uniref:uncharacterized protein n=1 Tax=Palaemon carinicauda TaxID=392227 RepID=UPI0035B69885
MNINNSTPISTTVCDLSVPLDCNLSLSVQIDNVVKNQLDEYSIQKLVINWVITRIDYCNSIYYKLPKVQLKKLQNMINRGARMIKSYPTPRKGYCYILLRELHWLPIKARMEFKICTKTHQVIRTGRPRYLKTIATHRAAKDRVDTRIVTDDFKLLEPKCISIVGFRVFEYATQRLYKKQSDSK